MTLITLLGPEERFFFTTFFAFSGVFNSFYRTSGAAMVDVPPCRVTLSGLFSVYEREREREGERHPDHPSVSPVDLCLRGRSTQGSITCFLSAETSQTGV